MFHRYKSHPHDIKLKLLGIDPDGRRVFAPVAGLNAKSKHHYATFPEQLNCGSTYWDITCITPMIDGKESFIAINPCNKPGDVIR